MTEFEAILSPELSVLIPLKSHRISSRNKPQGKLTGYRLAHVSFM